MLRLAVATVVCAAALAACGGRQRVRPKNDEYLAALKIEGNKTIATDDLLPGLSLKRTAEANRAVDPFVLQNDLKRVRGAYVRLGFFQVDVQTRLDHAGQATTVTIIVKEGPRAKTQVELVGLPTDNPKVAAAKLRKLVELAEGDPFDYDKYDDAKKTLLAAIEDEGYAHAQLGATVIADRVNGVAVARYIFDPGPACTFGAIEISGAPGDLEDAVRARLDFKPGDVYSATAIAKTQRALYELGRFSTVRVEPDHDLAATAIKVKVAVSVGTRHERKLGGGFGYEPLTYDVRARYGESLAGCLDALTTCSLDFQPAITLDHDFTTPEPKIRALAGLHRLDFLHPFVKGNAEIGFDYLTIEAYTYTGPHVKLGIETPLTPWLLVRAGVLFAYYGFVNINEIVLAPTRAQIGIDSFERLGELQQSFVIDLRDNPLAPTRGMYLETRLAEGGELDDGLHSFVQVVPDLRLYAPLGKYVLAGRARAGRFFGAVPPTERFYSGGAASQRGFNERALSPTVFNVDSTGSLSSVPIGGAVLAESSVEVRTPSFDILGVDVGFVTFLDYADVTETAAQLDLEKMHLATGLGFRIPTPIGAIRVDVGYRLNRTGLTEPEPTGFLRPFAIHFGIGEAY